MAQHRLITLLDAAAIVPKKRKKTKPTRASVERRLAGKSRRSEVKRNRGKVDY
jgi:ribosome-associated protein